MQTTELVVCLHSNSFNRHTDRISVECHFDFQLNCFSDTTLVLYSVKFLENYKTYRLPINFVTYAITCIRFPLSKILVFYCNALLETIRNASENNRFLERDKLSDRLHYRVEKRRCSQKTSEVIAIHAYFKI